ncbi:hypothetical protein ACFVIM_31260 [Streptomyces sp. NPDC057638]|uniref:hypothetical protein n=1 Tax=Streptomyces sp. NPDC057638 TaxID=3346190 RepID=UPI0036AA119C
MRDRRRRTDLLLPRERQSTDDNNPYAPPPEGHPDQPWQPRHPSGEGKDPNGSSGSGDSGGSGDSSGSSSEGRGGWGGQWSSRQPGRSGGGFGGRPGDRDQRPGGPSGLRWDPTDPVQRRARYALLSGMWAFFFAIFDFTEIALLLGALSVYWAISSLRAKDQRRPDPNTPAPAATAATPAGGVARSQRTAAVTGLVMGGIALVIVAATYSAQIIYRDFYTCERDALTKEGQVACNEKLPEPLRDVLGVKE